MYCLWKGLKNPRGYQGPAKLALRLRRPSVPDRRVAIFLRFMSCDRRARCGDFHSIKWYKENRRVFVYSPVVDFSKAEGELLERSSLALDSQEAKLTIDPILTTDEGEYKCEITFLDISKNCPVVQLVKLTTLARPQYANISLSRGQSSRPVMANSVVSGR